MIYKDYKRNHAIVPGREDALAAFLKQDYKGMQHKLRNAVSSHSEDALTWSCCDVLASLTPAQRVAAIDEVLEDSFQGHSPLLFRERQIAASDVTIHVGRQYTAPSTKEATEVDASIEAPGVLVFFEAKLYSSISAASPPEKPHDQIARKLRVGLDFSAIEQREFLFVFLDIAPVDMMFENRPKAEVLSDRSGGNDAKWRSAWLFQYYKVGRNDSLRPLTEALDGIAHPPAAEVAARMGWLTWADLFKCTLRAALTARS